MAIMEYLNQRKLASAKAKPATTEEPTLFESVSSKYKEKTPEMVTEIKNKQVDEGEGDLDLKIKAISARQKVKEDDGIPVKKMNIRDLDDRVTQRLKEIDEEKARLLKERVGESRLLDSKVKRRLENYE
jgi:hypothetical protein